ncbi:MAG: hypothetical protein AVDCRST_MAG79-1724, partial [uncultured Thermoleophilia bacterium]
MTDVVSRYDRRSFMAYFASVGLGGTLLPGVLWAGVHRGAEITPAAIASAEEIAGLTFTAEERAAMVSDLKSQATQVAELHKVALDNAVAPAIVFDPIPPGAAAPAPAGPRRPMVR